MSLHKREEIDPHDDETTGPDRAPAHLVEGPPDGISWRRTLEHRQLSLHATPAPYRERKTNSGVVRFPSSKANGNSADAPVVNEGKPRILYVITRAERGGAQMHVLNLACAMQQEFEVAIAIGEEGFLTQACRDREIPVHLVPHLQREISPIVDAQALWEIHALIRRLQPDLIHAHTFKAGFLARLAGSLLGVPSIYTIHTWLFGTPAMPRLWSVLGAPCERLAARWCHRLITVSELGASLVRKYRITSQAKIVTIHNGIPDCSERAELSAHASPVVTMVARFTEAKEHDILLRAFAGISPGPRLRLVGDGPLRETSEKLAEELGIQDRVEFLGDRDDVPSLLAGSDVFVLASKFEMFSISILEAMRAGLPVIASDVGGAREAIADGETGLLVPSGSVTALAAALRQVLEDLDLRQRLGRAARQRFSSRFLYARQEERTRLVYQDVLFGNARVAAMPETRTSPALEPVTDLERKIPA